MRSDPSRVGPYVRLHQLADVVLELERELRRIDEWERSPPSAGALRSDMPFCIDTLSFTQWLQWILLPRMRELIEYNQVPPFPCHITPAAEECLSREQPHAHTLLPLLRRLDALMGELGD